jgi:pyruvate dehydrogenase E1 component alpha subunit
MDVMEVYNASKEILEEIRGGAGPYFLEIVTYRYRGHSMGDPERYRKPDEIKKWQETDPIGIFSSYLIRENILSQEELQEIEQRVEKEVQEAIEFAENSPEPPPEALFEHIYADE